MLYYRKMLNSDIQLNTWPISSDGYEDRYPGCIAEAKTVTTHGAFG